MTPSPSRDRRTRAELEARVHHCWVEFFEDRPHVRMPTWGYPRNPRAVRGFAVDTRERPSDFWRAREVVYTRDLAEAYADRYRDGRLP